ncbi:AAA family ATPase [Wenjunlia tyrosinilytica]|uniref:ATPase AAA n=1 Tax=Wenjunlia tyrosinilytica TaxID=1544741 RepID=A0A917ZUE4_9ACTN|nr:MoxR family ATPase [Wenjunlia tyrosinilytica]GGO92363.1 ATPase AAA [Wenjunlia tyrosinilytica]
MTGNATGDAAHQERHSNGDTARAGQQWWLYQGTGLPLPRDVRDAKWPEPPHWRNFDGGPDLPPPPDDRAEVDRRLGEQALPFRVDPHEVSMVNAALYLRRPLLVTGRPGSGKSSLAFRIARELRLGRVLKWPITSRTRLRSGLYEFDTVGRAQASGQYWARVAAMGGVAALSESAEEDEPSGARADRHDHVGDYLHLGPLGTALLPQKLPRVLLIDELDKSDIDLPNDLLNIFEDGEFAVPELVRVRDRTPEVNVHSADPNRRVQVRDGIVRCHAFPVVVITSNGEREFPAPFLRRCLTLEMSDPDEEALAAMVAAHFPSGLDESATDLIRAFLSRGERVGGLAADQLLNAVYLATSGGIRTDHDDETWQAVLEAIWHRLSPAGP